MGLDQTPWDLTRPISDCTLAPCRLKFDDELVGRNPAEDWTPEKMRNMTERKLHFIMQQNRGGVYDAWAQAELSRRQNEQILAAVLASKKEVTAPQNKIIFISCGQFTVDELALGQQVKTIVEEVTDCKGYFAQNQSTLEALSTNILSALHRCVGFVGIMHHRGTVKTLSGEIIRASVWIEQEIAIAAFIQQVLKRPINIQLFIQNGIKLEGIREKLSLNPVWFSEANDITSELRKILPQWKTSIPGPSTNPVVNKLLDEMAAGRKITVSAMEPTGTERLVGNRNWKHGKESCEVLHVDEMTLRVRLLSTGEMTPIPVDWLTPSEDYQRGQFMVLVKAQG
jgi:hypothetical protein